MERTGWQKFCEICTIYPILEPIVAHMSASDAALLLALLGYLDDESYRALVKKHVTPIRDIPEHASWVISMINYGYTALLVGAGVDELHERYQNPINLWGEHQQRRPVTIWLAVMASPETRSNHCSVYRSERVAHGRVKRGRITSTEYRELLSEIETRRKFLPPEEYERLAEPLRKGSLLPVLGTSLGETNSEYLTGNRWSKWQPSTLQNDNKIVVISACEYTNDPESSMPLIYLCPDTHDGGTGDAWQNQRPKHPLAPTGRYVDYSWCKMSKSFTMPYENLRTSELSTSAAIDYDNGGLETWKSSSLWGFTVRFTCPLCDFHNDLHGIK